MQQCIILKRSTYITAAPNDRGERKGIRQREGDVLSKLHLLSCVICVVHNEWGRSGGRWEEEHFDIRLQANNVKKGQYAWSAIEEVSLSQKVK